MPFCSSLKSRLVQGKPAEGLLDLHGVTKVEGGSFGKMKSVITLTTKLREWSFAADNDAQMNEWVSHLKNSLAALDSEHALVRVDKHSEAPSYQYVEALDELPEEAKVIVRGMGFAREQLEGPKEFPILLNVLSWQTGNNMASKSKPNPYVTAANSPIGGTHYTTDAKKAGRRWVQETNSRTFEKTFKVAQQLGKGGYGTVFQAQMGKDKKNQVAVKKSENREEKARGTNLRELYYLMTLENPSIVRVMDCFDMQEQGQMWCVLEYMDGGTLTQARKTHSWTPAETAYIAKGMLTAVAFLHSKQVMHRDLKSGNVMFTVSGDVKLIDFGLATNYPEGGQKLNGTIGSAFWIPPEMIRGLCHNHKADIWSTGMCLFELVNGHIPFYEESKGNAPDGTAGIKGSRAMFYVGTGTPVPFDSPDDWDATAKDFFAQIQTFDPEARPEASELLKHGYLNTAVSQDAIKKMLIGVFRGAAMAMF